MVDWELFDKTYDKLEFEEEKVKAAQGRAKRYNKNKIDVSQVPPDVVLAIAKVLQANDIAHGGKYPRANWKGKDSMNSRMASLERHLLEFKAGKDIDSEDGQLLVDKILTNAMLLKWNYDHYPEMDDRDFKSTTNNTNEKPFLGF